MPLFAGKQEVFHKSTDDKFVEISKVSPIRENYEYTALIADLRKFVDSRNRRQAMIIFMALEYARDRVDDLNDVYKGFSDVDTKEIQVGDTRTRDVTKDEINEVMGRFFISFKENPE